MSFASRMMQRFSHPPLSPNDHKLVALLLKNRVVRTVLLDDRIRIVDDQPRAVSIWLRHFISHHFERVARLLARMEQPFLTFKRFWRDRHPFARKIRILSWAVREGDFITPGTPLLTFRFTRCFGLLSCRDTHTLDATEGGIFGFALVENETTAQAGKPLYEFIPLSVFETSRGNVFANAENSRIKYSPSVSLTYEFVERVENTTLVQPEEETAFLALYHALETLLQSAGVVKNGQVRPAFGNDPDPNECARRLSEVEKDTTLSPVAKQALMSQLLSELDDIAFTVQERRRKEGKP